MNTFMEGLKETNNVTLTENGAVTHRSTLNMVFDMFSTGGAYRNRSEDDCITLFKNAYEENPTLALTCLFYLRDIRGIGQGERRFFRVCFRWLAMNHPDAAKRNIRNLPEYGRWDDVIYTLVGTPLETDALYFIKKQLALDIECKTPSLLAKWLPSENASSLKTRSMGNIIRRYFGMSHKQYRKTLSVLRERINVLERLMSAGRWDEIEFDKIPSKAGFLYKNAFARRDLIAKKYETFAKDKTTKVNAQVLYPHEVAHQAFRNHDTNYDSVDRLMIQKYWDNLKDVYNGREENAIAVVDVSGSMGETPLEVAVSMGAYIAEKAHGPFAGHFITFSERPTLVKFEGVDITDKLNRCTDADWGMNTNIEAVFDMLLRVALSKDTKPEDIVERIYIFSDMQFDNCVGYGETYGSGWGVNCKYHICDTKGANTLMETIAKKWEAHGYKLPSVIFWNLDARGNNCIPAIGEGFSYVSGFSPSILEAIFSGKDGIDLMLEALNNERYNAVY